MNLYEMSKFETDMPEYLNQDRQPYTTPDGKELVGTTTISGRLQKFLTKWANNLGREGVCSERYLIHSANVGTVAHELISCHIQGIEAPCPKEYTPYMEMARACFEKFLQFNEDYAVEYLASELSLIDEHHGNGGTIDIYAKIEGIGYCLIDVKTGSGFYDEYFLQTTNYEHLLKLADKKVDKVLLLGCPREGKKYKLKVVTENGMHYARFLLMQCDYDLENALKDVRQGEGRSKQLADLRKLIKESKRGGELCPIEAKTVYLSEQ